MYSTTLLTERVPWTQLLANLVGLSGLLSVFGMGLSFTEEAMRRAGMLGVKDGGGESNRRKRGRRAQLEQRQGRGEEEEVDEREQPIKTPSITPLLPLATTINPLLTATEARSGIGGSHSTAAGHATPFPPPHPPAGWWVKHTFDQSTWFVNTVTREVVWEVPVGEGSGAGAAPVEAEVVWSKHSDASDTWFSNTAGDVVWALTMPQGVMPTTNVVVVKECPASSATNSPPSAAAAAASPGAAPAAVVLPEGWKAKTSGTTGETYYYHKRTGRTSWDVPS